MPKPKAHIELVGFVVVQVWEIVRRKRYGIKICVAPLPIFKEPPKEWILGFPERFMILDAKRPNRQTSDIDLDLALEIV